MSTSTRTTTSLLDLLAPLVSLLGLYLFIASFFLAKRSLPHASTCEDAATNLLQDTLGLTKAEVEQLQAKNILSGCWMDRRVDSMVMVVVDALRFDFALHHLPRSVGSRLHSSNTSRLLTFVADPPTVTMQRLKALTTGGLPTFADISGNMGGASVEEDTWIQQLKQTDFSKRQLSAPSKVAFVGDDTWMDLFPHLLDEAYPYPSFNTRDLDTVDNGCLHHIPDLLGKLRTRHSSSSSDLEVMIVHFLGVDHVGHTYGPHNEHMDSKLRQMDDALTDLLEQLDNQQDSCSVAFIFGDHGMTEDGNHGGGSEEEINAALFAHYSPACRVMTAFDGSEAAEAVGGEDAQTAFKSIHQIDLVPTLSLLLGLPIPYANLGSLVPALALLDNSAQTVTALALNSAQVWRYFTMYSSTANQLPGLEELEERLKQAVAVWKDGLAHPDGDDSSVYLKACSLFKLFLSEALELGQRVWTRFDTTGMALGASVILGGIVLWCVPLVARGQEERIPWQWPPPGQIWELLLTFLFIVFSCGVLTFGNSYILEEEHVCMFMIGVLGFVLAVRLASTNTAANLQRYAPLMIPMASRLGELFVTGHGQDPSVQAHNAHHPAIFLSSLVVLIVGRWYLNNIQFTPSLSHMMVDCATLACLGQSWWDKRQPDPERHGFAGTRCAIAMVLIGLPISIYQAYLQQGQAVRERKATSGIAVTIIIKLLLLIMIVTGPSSATSVALFSAQGSAIFVISRFSGPSMIPSAVLAALWRLIIRHVFFATNHGCTFSRLQLSAAFVATSTFNFFFAGASLFINTFGWEIVGLSFAWVLASSSSRRWSLWRWYCLYQLIETLCSCISVSVLRRHLMVWDVYAPHFLFVAIFQILFAAFQLLVCYFGYRANVR